jgi:hypothetical protein
MLAWQAWAAEELPVGEEPLTSGEAEGELQEPGAPGELENLALPGTWTTVHRM